MTNIQFLNEKGSKTCKMLIEETGITRCRKMGKLPEILINYGVSGAKREKFFAKYPNIKRIPMLNARCGMNKLYTLQILSDSGILTPQSKTSLNPKDLLKDWIEKKYNSYGGQGICKARGRGKLVGKYYQKFVEERDYELRVHAFSWIPEKEWSVLKRTGDKNTIAWNYSQGGHFSTMKGNPDIVAEVRQLSTKILRLLHLEFGALDFIVDKRKRIYFIEVNSQPGMSGLSNNTYKNAFLKLKGMVKENILRYFNHIV